MGVVKGWGALSVLSLLLAIVLLMYESLWCLVAALAAVVFLVLAIVQAVKTALASAKAEKEDRAKKAEAAKKRQEFEALRAKLREEQTYDFKVPLRKNGLPRVYAYTSVDYNLTDVNAARKAILEKSYTVEPVIQDGVVHLYADGHEIGTCAQFNRMIMDFLNNGDEVLIYLERLAADESDRVTTATIGLAFYKDRRKGCKWKEQTTVALTNYRSEEIQSVLGDIMDGDPVKFVDSDIKDDIWVYCWDREIGRLPKGIAKRLEDEEFYGAFVDEIEVESNSKGDVYKPTIRIYW